MHIMHGKLAADGNHETQIAMVEPRLHQHTMLVVRCLVGQGTGEHCQF